MGSYQHSTKKNVAQSTQQHAPPTVVPQLPQAQPQSIRAKSNEEGLAEHAERLRKFQRLGNSLLEMGPPRFDNDMTSPLQPKPWIQRKMTLGEPGDKYEQEADRVASQVVQQINTPSFPQFNQEQSVQRENELVGEMQAKGFRAAIQRRQAMTDEEASADLESAINRARGSGQPLDSGLQQSMGLAMGTDFSGVQVHTDAQSDQLNQSIQARAFTTGQDVFFQEGAYQPGSRGGQELIAHELTHVVQQSKDKQPSYVKQLKTSNSSKVAPELTSVRDVHVEKKPQNNNEIKREANIKILVTNDSIDANRVIQRKRDIENEKTKNDFKNWGFQCRGNAAKPADTLEVVNKNYKKSLASGLRLKEKGIKWFMNASDNKLSVESKTLADVKKIGYTVFWYFNNTKASVNIVRGYGLESKEVDGYRVEFHDKDGKLDYDKSFVSTDDYDYANTYDVGTGKFTCINNNKANDTAVAKSLGLSPALNNSEIIWFTQAFAQEKYKEKHPNTEPLSNITSITRDNISNTQTLDTIFMSDDKREAWNGGRVMLDEPTDEGWALLGTPNGNSAVWILIQHTKSGTVDIESVEFKKDELIINYMTVG